jgi:hypothetical protein
LTYPREALVADAARAGAGLLITLGPVALLPLARPALAALVAVAALFLVFGVQTLRRLRLRLDLDQSGLIVGPGARRLDWAELRGLSLAYYALRKDDERGWFELIATTPGLRLRVDSRLQGFEQLVRSAAAAAERVALELDPRTCENLAALVGGDARGAADHG